MKSHYNITLYTKMCKLSTKGSMELRIGNICVLIIYIPIFRFGNCKKFPQMEYYIVYSCRKVVIDRSSQNAFVFSSKVFSNNVYWHVKNWKRSWYFAHRNSWNASINFRRRILESRPLRKIQVDSNLWKIIMKSKLARQWKLSYSSQIYSKKFKCWYIYT